MKLPKWLQRVKDVWMAISRAIGFVVSKILLTILWTIVFGLYNLVYRIGKGVGIIKKPDGWLDTPAEFEGSLYRQF